MRLIAPCFSASRQKLTSSVLKISQGSTYQLYHSIIATRYINPLFILMYILYECLRPDQTLQWPNPLVDKGTFLDSSDDVLKPRFLGYIASIPIRLMSLFARLRFTSYPWLFSQFVIFLVP